MVPAEPRPHESDCQQHRAPASSFCGSIIPSLFPIPGTVAASCACLCDICVPLFALSPLRYLVNSCFYQIISVKILGVVLVPIQQAARFADPARRERGPGPLRSNPRRSVPLAHVSVTATFPCEIIRVGDSPFTELRGNEYLLSSRGVLPLPPLCPSSASSRRPVYARFLLHQRLPGFILSGPSGSIVISVALHQALLPSCSSSLSSRHSVKPKPGSPHPLPPMPRLVNAGRELQPPGVQCRLVPK